MWKVRFREVAVVLIGVLRFLCSSDRLQMLSLRLELGLLIVPPFVISYLANSFVIVG